MKSSLSPVLKKKTKDIFRLECGIWNSNRESYLLYNEPNISKYEVTDWPIIGIGIRYSSEFTCHSTIKQQGNVELLLFS